MKMHSLKSRIGPVASIGVACSLVVAIISFAPPAYAQTNNAVGDVEGENLCTPGNSCDTTPPTVSMTAPANNATVSGCSVTVSANASDNVAVASVEFDESSNGHGGPIATDTSAPYTATWNTTGVANGSYTLTATATDTSNNQTTSSPITVTVSNSAPIAGDINCDGTVNIFDLSIMLSSYGASTTTCTTQPQDTCDISGPSGTADGLVNNYDLQVVISNFGQ